jgi:hypothetical protein
MVGGKHRLDANAGGFAVLTRDGREFSPERLTGNQMPDYAAVVPTYESEDGVQQVRDGADLGGGRDG